MPVAVTVLPLPAFLSAKAPPPLPRASWSPAMRSSVSVMEADALPSYTLLAAEAATFSARCAMLAVVLAVVAPST
ncbi:hypothetical protein D3C72_2515530 [compost metagenome]